MPEISRFEGIIITMYFSDHNPPHFHAEYNGMEAIFDLTQGVFAKGSLPSRQSRFVLAWYEYHKDELMEIWNTKSFRKVDPLTK